jgi:hypothetical protein
MSFLKPKGFAESVEDRERERWEGEREGERESER